MTLSTTNRIFQEDQSVSLSGDEFIQQTSTWEIAKRVAREHLLPHKLLLIISSISMIFAASATGAVPYLIQIAADDIFIGKKEEMIMFVALAVLAVTIVKALAEFGSKIAVSYLGLKFVAGMRQQIFDKLLEADLAWMDKIHSGRLVSLFLTDTNLVREMASRTLVGLIENMAKIIILVGVMLWLDWRMTLLILFTMPIGIFFMGRQRKKVRKATDDYASETGELASFISQTVRNMRVVRAYGQQTKEQNNARNVIHRSMEFILRGERSKAISAPIVEMLAGIGFAAAIYFAGKQGMQGSMTFGEFTGFMAATMLLYQPLKSVATLQTTLQEGIAAASRIYGILDRPLLLKDQKDAYELQTPEYAIRFRNVSFGYEKGEKVLKDFNLEVPEGKTVALVGPSGAGKSTILSLALRFYDPDSGQISIGNEDISRVTLQSLREKMALVTQDPVMFADTIEGNIGYGQPEYNREDIEKAARSAAAHAFILRQPKGYETDVMEAGNSLSGGEKQRIAIARSFLRNAPILLLDEPTSSLDAHSEEIVQKSLDSLLEGRTVLVIAHRLSTIKKADIICVLDKGRIIEQGKHEELLALEGLYSRLYHKQYGTDQNAAKAAE